MSVSYAKIINCIIVNKIMGLYALFMRLPIRKDGSMSVKQPYRVDKIGRKASRRNYSKISGTLELPDLVEIQTHSLDWLIKEGLQEVFDEVYQYKIINKLSS